MAQIVSLLLASITSLSHGVGCVLYLLGDYVLLSHRKQVVDHSVENQTGREPQEEESEHNR